MTFKHDFSGMDDYELEQEYKSLTFDLDGGKVYWYTDEVGRDHDRWRQLREEIHKREQNELV